MCGITGFVSGKKETQDGMKDIIDSMTESIRWRGPDGKGVYIDSRNEATVGLGHCRLAILDLSDKGGQPMISVDGNWVITYNGEIYNYKEIRKKLEQTGYHFVSDCDTEVLLYACEEYGIETAVSMFNGMYAFALYDKKKGEIILARDRLGVKPLYYWQNGTDFAFSSDIRALYGIPEFEKKLNYKALYGYIWNMYIPAPYTIFENVNKLEPGRILRYNISNCQIKKHTYWELLHIQTQFPYSYEEYLLKLKSLLRNSVNIRMEADVPVGVFLSGGVDSSLISALAQEQSEKKIRTYSIGFYEKDDDAKAAKEVAGVIGSDHQELYCSVQDAINLIEKIPIAYAEPFADNSQIPTMLLSKLTREYVTVSLSGDGGDELFIGYPSYLTYEKLYKSRKLSRIASCTIGKYVDRILPLHNYSRWKIDKLCNATGKDKILQLDYVTAAGILDSILPIEDRSTEDPFKERYYSENTTCSGRNILTAGVLQGIKIGLPDDMLVKVDRASMFYSLECRSPLLDYRVAESSLSVPNEFKYRDGRLKAPLKDILYEYVPKAIVDRPKSGFGVPINIWMHNGLNKMLNDYLSTDYIKKQGIFDVNGIETFIRAFNRAKNPILDKIAYNLLVFQLWWKEYC